MDRECQWCGRAFQAARFWSKARFCSNKCRSAWNADRKRTKKLLGLAVNRIVYACARLGDGLASEEEKEAVSLIYRAIEAASGKWSGQE